MLAMARKYSFRRALRYFTELKPGTDTQAVSTICFGVIPGASQLSDEQGRLFREVYNVTDYGDFVRRGPTCREIELTSVIEVIVACRGVTICAIRRQSPNKLYAGLAFRIEEAITEIVRKPNLEPIALPVQLSVDRVF